MYFIKLKISKLILFSIICTTLFLSLVGCNPGTGNNVTIPPELQQPEQQAKINLVQYDGGYFTLLLPEGWQIQTMGKYTTFGFRAWDPQNPDYEIFYYGILAPLNKSINSKNEWGNYLGNMGFANARINYDAPAIDEKAAESIFYVFNNLQTLSNNYSLGFNFPALENFTPLKNIPLQTPFSAVSSNEAMVFAGVRGSNGGTCGGLFMSSILKTNPYYINGVDMMPTSAINVSGIIAPVDNFKNVEMELSQSLYSLRFSENYIREGIAYSKAVGEAAMADNAARQAVFDKANKAWSDYFRGNTSTLDEINNLLDNLQDTLNNLD